MKTGLAIWHYPQRTLTENAEFFLSHGFDSVSALGTQFLELATSEAQSQDLCRILEAHAAPLTVHHRLPDPDDTAQCDLFFSQIDCLAAWQDTYGAMDILSFDTWFDRQRLHPYLLYAVRKFRGKRCHVACEDYPLQESERRWMQGLEKQPHVGMLLDLGHLNLRLHAGENGHPKTMKEAFDALPLAILELHVHSNQGKKDEHDFIQDRPDLLTAWARELKTRSFEGIVTIESVPPWQGKHGDEGDAAILEDLRAWQEAWANA